MSSSYFSFAALAKFALARAEQLNAIFSAIDVGFGKLPDPDALNQQRHNYVTAGGTANVITVSLPKAPAAYVEGLRLSVKISATTTTNATINVNGLGAKAIVRANGDATAANDLVAGQIVDMQYDGSVFRLIAASEVLAAASAVAAAASAAAADASADAAAASATAADASADAAAASAADAASATKVAKAGDTMTGDLTLSNAALRVTHSTSVPSIYLTQGGNGFSRIRYAYTGQPGANFALRDETAGVDRLTIDSTGIATFSSAVIATGGIVFGRNSASDEKFRASGTSPFFSAYNAAETTRLGYLQFLPGNTALASDAGTVSLVTSGGTAFTIDGNRDIAGPRGMTLTGTLAAAVVTAGDANFAAAIISANPRITFDSGSDYLEYNRAGNIWSHVIGGTTRLTVNGSGASVAGTFDSSGTLSQAGNAVWHAGNFDPTLKANLASPTLTGTPAAPTAAGGTNTTQIATTAFVQAAITGLNLATTYAPIASPTFTGTPAAPTAADATNTTQIATTAWVRTRINNTLSGTYAPLAAPALTGIPTAPTATFGTATTQLATTAFADALRDLPQNAQAAGYTLALTDRAKHVYYSGAGGHSYTIPANATIAFPVGTTIVIVNDGTGNLTLARAASVVMRWSQTGADANRTLAPGGMATLLKVATDRWIVSGAGLS